jgi:hypothetical protein
MAKKEPAPSRPPRSGGRWVFGAVTLLLVVSGLVIWMNWPSSEQQLAAVQRFSAVTIDFTTLVSLELVRHRDAALEMNKLRIQLNDNTIKPDRMDAHFTLERVTVRVDALYTLQEYAMLLHALVTPSQQAQLKGVSDSFVTSLRNAQGVSLSDDKARAIRRAVQQVKWWVFEYKRARATHEVVTASHDAILQLVDLIQRDFDPKAEHWSLGYALVIQSLVGAANFAAVGPNAAISTPLIGEAKVVAAQNQERFTFVSVRVVDSAAALREAQINLYDMLQGTAVTYEDIDRYVAQIQDFVRVYRNLPK